MKVNAKCGSFEVKGYQKKKRMLLSIWFSKRRIKSKCLLIVSESVNEIGRI